MSDWSAGRPQRGPKPNPNPGGYDYYRDFHRPTAQRTPDGQQRAPQRQAPPTRRSPGEGPAARPPAKKKRRWGRGIGITLLVIVLLLGGLTFYFDSQLHREPALADMAQSADTPGTNWLLVGSDSREGLNSGRQKELGAGDAAGRRTDTMMLVHIPEGGGQPALISLPRDSYVPVPGHGRDKLNSAYSYGGSRLLAKTVEGATGVHIDHYAEIGLGGFADLVDSVGGVDVCLNEPVKDPKASLDLRAGCQELQGPQALGFVRTRAFGKGDLKRVENQRKVLSALVDKATGPATLLNPFRLFPLASSGAKTFLVNDSDHIWHLASLAMAMGDVSGGQGVTTTVPFGEFGEDDNGQSVIKWDEEKAPMMFGAIAKDQPIPPEALPK